MYCETVRNGRSTSSKVIDFDINRKRVCDFLLVIILFVLCWTNKCDDDDDDDDDDDQ